MLVTDEDTNFLRGIMPFRSAPSMPWGPGLMTRVHSGGAVVEEHQEVDLGFRDSRTFVARDISSHAMMGLPSK